MFLYPDPSPLVASTPTSDPIERELREIEDLRQRALDGQEILYCSAMVQRLVREDVARLIEIIRRLRRGKPGGTSADPAVEALLAELRRDLSVLQDLVELR